MPQLAVEKLTPWTDEHIQEHSDEELKKMLRMATRIFAAYVNSESVSYGDKMVVAAHLMNMIRAQQE